MSRHLTDIRGIVQEWVEAARRRPAHATLVLGLAASLIWVYGAMVVGVLRYSTTNSLWYHCMAVPFGAAWIWYRKRLEIIDCPAKPWWSGGSALLILAFLMRLAELGEGGFLFGGVSLVLAVAAITALLGGRERLKRALFPIAFLLFAVPIPKAVFGAIAFPMQQVSASSTAVACRALGLQVVHDGVNMTMGDFSVTVAAACSGLSSMFALLMCGTWIVGFASVAWYHRLWMLVAIGPVVLFGNIFRLVIMMVVALFFGGDAALGFFHQGSDLIIFLLLASFLLSAKMRLERHHQLLPAAPPCAEETT